LDKKAPTCEIHEGADEDGCPPPCGGKAIGYIQEGRFDGENEREANVCQHHAHKASKAGHDIYSTLTGANLSVDEDGEFYEVSRSWSVKC
jgi:hypothetical protein